MQVQSAPVRDDYDNVHMHLLINDILAIAVHAQYARRDGEWLSRSHSYTYLPLRHPDLLTPEAIVTLPCLHLS